MVLMVWNVVIRIAEKIGGEGVVVK